MSEIKVVETNEEELKDIYTNLEFKDQIIQFLINSLVCSAYNQIEPDDALEIVGAVTNYGPPPFDVYLEIAKVATKLLEEGLDKKGLN